MSKIREWFKRRVLKFLGLDGQYFISADLHCKKPSEYVVCKINRNGTIEVVGEYNIETQSNFYCKVVSEMQRLAQKYKVPEERITVDLPRY